MNWLTVSSDLYPIEPMWEVLKRRILKRSNQQQNLFELDNALVEKGVQIQV